MIVTDDVFNSPELTLTLTEDDADTKVVNDSLGAETAYRILSVTVTRRTTKPLNVTVFTFNAQKARVSQVLNSERLIGSRTVALPPAPKIYTSDIGWSVAAQAS